MSLWNWLVWLATVDYMWISAGASILFISIILLMIKYGVVNNGTNAEEAGKILGNSFFIVIIIWLMVLVFSYGVGGGAATTRFPHFLLWHLVALGAVVTGIAGWFSVKGLRKLWGPTKNFAKNLFGKWQSKQDYLKNIRGTKINEDLELRRKELEKLMDDGVISESIREQVNSLFKGPFMRLLSMRQFLLENTEVFDAATARVLNNSTISDEAKKEISERREGLNKTLLDVNTRLSQIALAVDGLIIRMGEIRTGLDQGSTHVEETLNELNEIVEAIEGSVSEMQKTVSAGAPEEFSSVASPVQDRIKV